MKKVTRQQENRNHRFTAALRVDLNESPTKHHREDHNVRK